MSKGFSILAIGAVLACNIAVAAPTLVWTNTQAGSTADGGDFFTSAGTDAAGNAYAVGTVLNGASPNDFADIAIVKYNSAGVVQWTRMYDRNGFDDVAFDAKVDSAGNVYVCGYSSLDNTSTNTDVLVLKVTTANVVAFATTYVPGANNVDEYSYKIAVNALSECYIAGEAGATGAVPYDAAIYKVSAAGAFVWQRVFAGSGLEYDALGDIAVASNGDAVACGLISNTNADAIVCRVTPANVIVFNDTYAPTGSTFNDTEAVALSLNSTGDAFVTGITFKEDTPGFRQEAWVRRYGTTGTVAYTTIYDGNATGITTARDIVVDGTSNAIFVGETTVGGTLDANANQYVRKLGPTGTLLVSNTRDGGFGDFYSSVGILASGRIVCAGYSFLDGSPVPANCDGVLTEYASATLAQDSVVTYNGLGNDWDQWLDMTVDGSSVYLTGGTYANFTDQNGLVNRYNYAAIINPASYTIVSGLDFGGSLASLFNSDNDPIFVLLDEFDATSRVQFDSTSPIAAPTSIKVHCEFKSSRNDLTCFSQAWNYTTNTYVSFDVRVSTIADVAFIGNITGTLANFVGPASAIRTRHFTVTNQDVSDIDGWTVAIDRWVWEIQ